MLRNVGTFPCHYSYRIYVKVLYILAITARNIAQQNSASPYSLLTSQRAYARTTDRQAAPHNSACKVDDDLCRSRENFCRPVFSPLCKNNSSRGPYHVNLVNKFTVNNKQLENKQEAILISSRPI